MGEVSRKTGLVFFRYYKQRNVERESWITPEKFALKRRQHKKRCSKYRTGSREKVRQNQNSYYERNRELCTGRNLDWQAQNPHKLRTYRKRSYSKHREQRLQSKKEKWHKRDTKARRQHNAKRRHYLKSRKSVDPLFRFVTNVRSMISSALAKKGYAKRSKTEKIVGCTFPKLKAHLESLFKKGMSWDNYGTWHIDHFVPLASASTEEGIIRLNHYTNLRPLWGEENLSKLARMPSKEEIKQFRSMKRRR